MPLHYFRSRIARKGLLFAVALCCFSFLIAARGIASNEKLTTVTLQLKWQHQFQFAGYYAAKEKGFYRQAGLDVEILEGGPEIKVQDVVLSREAQFGVLGSELLYLRAQGRKIVALAPIMQHSIRTIIAREDSQIVSPHDFYGKTLLLNKNEMPEFQAMFLNEGVDLEKITILDKGKTANQQLMSGEVDAINGSLANQPFLFEKNNVPFNLIRPITYGIDFYGDTLFTTQEMVKARPELITAFLTASSRGWKYAFDHSDELIDIVIQKYGAKKSRSHLDYEHNRLRSLILPDLVEIGHNNRERWQHIKGAYQRLGMIDDDFSLKGFFFEDYQSAPSVLIKRLIGFLGLVLVVLTMVFLWNFQLRRQVARTTRAVKESRENLKVTLHSIGDGVIAVDLEGRIMTMNPVAEKLTGWSFQEAGGLELPRVFHIVHSKTREKVENPVKRVLAEGCVVGLANHTVLISKSGIEYQIADSGAPIKDATGNIIGVVLVFRDMTEEYRTLEKIKEDEKKFRSYVQNAPYGIFVIDQSGCILEVNDTFCMIAGEPEETLVQKSLDKMVSPDEYVGIQHALTMLPDAGKASFVFPWHSGEGDTRTWAFDMIKLSPKGFLCFVNDITMQKQVEQALSQSNSYLQTLIKTIPDLVWLKDSQGVYLFCNSRFERFFGATEEEIVGKTDFDFVDEELARFFRKHDKVAMEKGGPSIYEEEVTYADDGHREYLETIKTPMYDSGGQLIGVLGIARDITERLEAEKKRKKLESQLRQALKMEAVGTIAGGVAHDFNNILSIIIGNTELAVDEVPDWNPARLNLDEIKTASLRARDVVKQLLSFSRKSEDAKKTIDIREILLETVRLIRASIPASIEINLDASPGETYIEADPTQIHQVLINLCTNASHAMEEKGGVLAIRLSSMEVDTDTVRQFQEIQPGQYAVLKVSDTGQGIDPSIKDKIFDPYFTTKEVGKVTGMGLAVVMGIVKSHHGAILVYSEPGNGTTFKLLFPIVGAVVPNHGAMADEPPKGSGRILFVDDEASLTTLGKAILERLGYTVVVENNPEKALAMVKNNPDEFDLVITDMTMPSMTGDVLSRKILQINSAMPIILCSGFSSKINLDRIKNSGIRKFIEKPVSKHDLAQAVSEVLPGDSQKKPE